VIAIEDGRHATLTHGQLARQARAIGAGLSARGVSAGDRVGLFAPNSARWIAACLGAIAAGAIAVPIDVRASEEDLDLMLRAASCRWLFTTRALDERARRARDGIPTCPIILDSEGPVSEGGLPLDVLLGDPEAPPRPGTPDDAALLFFTSGTTGRPKGVPLSHRNILANLDALRAENLIGSDDRVALPLPLHHTYPFTVGLLGALDHGAAVILPGGWTGPRLIEAVTAGQANVMIGVPRLYEAMVVSVARRLGGAGRALLRLSARLARRLGPGPGRVLFAAVRRRLGPRLRLLVCGGAHLAAEIEACLQGLGFSVLSGYGLAETAPILTLNQPGRARLGSAGRPIRGVTLRIEVGDDQPFGAVLVRGPNVFAGYWHDPEETRRAFTADGWFRTGDLGRLDRDGYLHLTARDQERIVLPNGEKVLPERIETVFAASPRIQDIAVFARNGRLAALVVPDEAVVRARGAARWAAEIREEIELRAARLRPFERPSAVAFTRTPLPRTSLGKIRRFRIPELFRLAEAGAIRPARETESAAADRELLETPLAAAIMAWLRQRFAGTRIGLDSSPQLDLGIDSLGWLDLTLEVRERFARDLSEEAVGRILTLRDLVEEILAAPAPRTPPAAPDEEPARGWRIAAGWLLFAVTWLAMHVLFRLRVAGRGALQGEGPWLFTPNHCSYLDPFALAAALPFGVLRRTHWAGWSEILFSSARRRHFSRLAQVFPIDPARAGMSGIAAAQALLGRGRSLVWFPEGRRSPDGSLRAFSPGVGLLLRGAAVQVVPVRIVGTHAALPPTRRRVRLAPIAVVFGSPVPSTTIVAAHGDDNERIAGALRDMVEALSTEGLVP
jgi:long-chain acyl-CoA synthetase